MNFIMNPATHSVCLKYFVTLIGVGGRIFQAKVNVLLLIALSINLKYAYNHVLLHSWSGQKLEYEITKSIRV